MQIKSGFEQAAYALLLLHRCRGEQAMSIEQLSQKMNVSPSYLQKLMRRLVQSDLVVSVPGAKGGFRLHPKHEAITLYDIYVAMEGKQSLFSPNGIFHHAFSAEEVDECVLTKVMSEAEACWIAKLKSHTITSLDTQLTKTKEIVI